MSVNFECLATCANVSARLAIEEAQVKNYSTSSSLY